MLYDAAGNVTGVKDARGNVTQYLIDAMNRVTFTYNEIGLLTSTTNRMRMRRDFQYDAANRLTTQTWFDSSGTPTETLTYNFDPNGNQLTAGNSNGTYTMTYDALNRVTVAKDIWGNTLTFTYDAVGNRTNVQDSKGGTTTSVYDAANNLVTRLYSASGANPLRIDLTYNAVNQIQTQTRYSDLTGTTKVAYTTYTYDVVNRVRNIQHRKGSDNSNIANYTYTYDPGSRLTTEVRNGTTTTYTYDTTNQLTADGTNTFTYDGTGNRNSNNGSGNWTAVIDNRLSSDGTWTYTYNDEGDLVTRSKGLNAETWTYGYDAKNELIWVEKRATDGGTLQMHVDYKYDAFGNRIQKAVDNNGDGVVDTTQRYAYDGWKMGGQSSSISATENWDIWADLDGLNNLQTRYMRGNAVDQLFARLDSGTAYWSLTDRLGSARDITDDSGVIKDTLAYDGFGNINITSETNSNFRGRYAWTGRELDTETTLQYNRARYYNAAAGRWLTQDPLGFDAGDSNLYRYVQNAPQVSRDPTGLEVYAYGRDGKIADDLQAWFANDHAGFWKEEGPGIATKKVAAGDHFVMVPLDLNRLKELQAGAKWKDNPYVKALGSPTFHMEVWWSPKGVRPDGYGVYKDDKGTLWQWSRQTFDDQQLVDRLLGEINNAKVEMVSTTRINALVSDGLARRSQSGYVYVPFGAPNRQAVFIYEPFRAAYYRRERPSPLDGPFQPRPLGQVGPDVRVSECSLLNSSEAPSYYRLVDVADMPTLQTFMNSVLAHNPGAGGLLHATGTGAEHLTSVAEKYCTF